MDLKQKWLDGIGGAKQRSTLVRWYLYLSFGASIPVLIYNWWDVQPKDTMLYGKVGTPTPFPFFQLFLTIALLAAVLFLVRKYSVIPKASANLIPLPPALSTLRSDLDSLADEMGLLQSDFSTVVDTRNFGMNPHIAQLSVESANDKVLSGPSVILVLPLGFLKLFQEDPATSRAILAHELAHVRQEDWQIWGFISSYAEAMKKLVLPVVLLFGSFGLIEIGQLVHAERQVEAASDNVRDYAEVFASARQDRDQMQALSSGGMFGMGRQDLSLDPEAKIRQLNEQIFDGFLAAGQALIVPLLQLLLLRIILRMRAKSEALADLAAVAYVGAKPLLRALYRCGSKQSRWNLFTTHPSLKNRINAIRAAANDPANILSDEEDAPMGHRASRHHQPGPGFLSLFTNGQSAFSNSRLLSFCVAYYFASVINLLLPRSSQPIGGLSDLYFALSYPLSDLIFAGILMALFRLKRNFWIALAVACAGHLFSSALTEVLFNHDIGFWHVVKGIWLYTLIADGIFFSALYLLLRRFSFGKSLLIAALSCFVLSAINLLWRKYDLETTVTIMRGQYTSYALCILILFLWGTTFRSESQSVRSVATG